MRPRFSIPLLFLALMPGLPVLCTAQSVPGLPSGSLTDQRILSQLNALEQSAASANQGTYNELLVACANGCSPELTAVFESVEELVHTANELLGIGPTDNSLGLDIEGLGFALRWTAAEEMAAQGSMTTEFAANQLSAMASRVAALRWGIGGLRTVQTGSGGEKRVLVASSSSAPRGGGASADADSLVRRWGWFIDGAFGYGNKDPTVLEDAFDFDGQEITVGLDYRFSPALVAGVIVGYTDKEIDFDSSLSIVDGGIESDGYSGMLYLLAEGDKAFISGSLGYQTMSHDIRRRITYPSLNPLVPGTDSTALSDTDSEAILATLGFGYQFRLAAFAVEPSINASYTDATVDGFGERSFPTGDPGSGEPDPFDLRIGGQDIESLDLAASLKLQYVFTPSFGVIVPYARGSYHRELLDDARRVSAIYGDAASVLGGASATDFAVATDEPDEEYYSVSGGFSVVLQGGLQGFLQYTEILDLESYTESVISGGFRYEF